MTGDLNLDGSDRNYVNIEKEPFPAPIKMPMATGARSLTVQTTDHDETALTLATGSGFITWQIQHLSITQLT